MLWAVKEKAKPGGRRRPARFPPPRTAFPNRFISPSLM